MNLQVSDGIQKGISGENSMLSREYTVGEISSRLRCLVEGEFPSVRVRGEISGYRGPHSSGHSYFALKDANARLDAIIWRGTLERFRFKPEEGLEVIATGRLTTYPSKSGYQIIIEALEPAGAGASMVLLEERKRRLAAEGLFAEERKRSLPFLPEVIGVVTSPTGAVIQDILNRLRARCPRHVLVWPVRVQGESCAEEVSTAIIGFNRLNVSHIPKPDVIIVARGGGSYEELWGFNEESVVRAVAQSAIPVISAVGHETDWTLIDLVADKRAPTPTAAAEMAVPVRSELMHRLADLSKRQAGAVIRRINRLRQDVGAVTRGLPQQGSDVLALPQQRLDMVAMCLSTGLEKTLHTHALRLSQIAPRLNLLPLRQRAVRDRKSLLDLSKRLPDLVKRLNETRRRDVGGLTKLLESLGYRNVLTRGYGLVRNREGHILRSVSSIARGEILGVELVDGVIQVTAGEVFPSSEGIKDPSGAQKKDPSGKDLKSRVSGNQEELFF